MMHKTAISDVVNLAAIAETQAEPELPRRKLGRAGGGFYQTESRVDHPGTASSRARWAVLRLIGTTAGRGIRSGLPRFPCPRLPVPDNQYPPGDWFWDHGGQGAWTIGNSLTPLPEIRSADPS
jgi:hypothetical protein